MRDFENKKTGLNRIITAFGHTSKGFSWLSRNEAAFRQELALLVLAIPLAFVIAQTSIQLILLISSLVLVIIVELINSAIEVIVDRVGSEKHELSGRAKDIGSAAVLVALMNAFFIWAVIIFNNFLGGAN